MSTIFRRITFLVPPEMEAPLDAMKREVFYNQSQSEMIRALITAGLKVKKTQEQKTPKIAERKDHPHVKSAKLKKRAERER